MEAKKNIYWINAVKAFAIIAVFLSHVQAIYGYHIGIVHRFISPWYVNAFFFVSGYLLFRKQLSTPLVLQPKSLYISRLNGGVLADNQCVMSDCGAVDNFCCHRILPVVHYARAQHQCGWSCL